MPFFCLKTAWSWTKTLVRSINVTLFLCVVALATYHFAVCEDLFGVPYVEAAANCEIISRNAYDASNLVMKQLHDLSKEKSAAAHTPGVLSILSILLIFVSLLHGSFLVLKKVCDCILKRPFAKHESLDATEDDSFRDDAVDDKVHANCALQGDAIVNEQTNQINRFEENHTRQIDKIEEHRTLQHDTIEEQNRTAPSIHDGAASSSSSYEFGCSASRRDPNFSERVEQSTPMNEHSGLFVESSQTVMLDSTTAAAPEHRPTTSSQELEDKQEPMDVDESASTPNATNDDLTGPDAQGDELMDIDEPNEPTNEDGLMSSEYRNSIASDPNVVVLNQTPKKRSSLGHLREGSEKKRKTVRETTSEQLSAFQNIDDGQEMVRLAGKEMVRVAEQAEQEKARKAREAETKKKEDSAKEVAQTQVADDGVDPPFSQNQRTHEPQTSRVGGSNAHPVSLLSEDEDDDSSGACPSAASPSSSDDEGRAMDLRQEDRPTTRNSGSSTQNKIAKALVYDDPAAGTSSKIN
jgi:hypothetical protein